MVVCTGLASTRVDHALFLGATPSGNLQKKLQTQPLPTSLAYSLCQAPPMPLDGPLHCGTRGCGSPAGQRCGHRGQNRRVWVPSIQRSIFTGTVALLVMYMCSHCTSRVAPMDKACPGALHPCMVEPVAKALQDMASQCMICAQFNAYGNSSIGRTCCIPHHFPGI